MKPRKHKKRQGKLSPNGHDAETASVSQQKRFGLLTFAF